MLNELCVRSVVSVVLTPACVFNGELHSVIANVLAKIRKRK